MIPGYPYKKTAAKGRRFFDIDKHGRNIYAVSPDNLLLPTH